MLDGAGWYAKSRYIRMNVGATIIKPVSDLLFDHPPGAQTQTRASLLREENNSALSPSNRKRHGSGRTCGVSQ